MRVRVSPSNSNYLCFRWHVLGLTPAISLVFPSSCRNTQSESYPGREHLAREIGVDPTSDTPLLSSLLTRSPVHPSPFSQSALHTPSHHLPHHAASFPTSLSSSHHHSSHHQHHITNGNSLLPLSPDTTGTHARPHHQHVITMATSGISTQTTTVTTATGNITTTTGGKSPPSSTTSLTRPQEKESSLAGGQGRTPGTQGSGSNRQDTGTLSSQRELDDFFGTLPPISSLPPPPPMTHPSTVDR